MTIWKKTIHLLVIVQINKLKENSKLFIKIWNPSKSLKRNGPLFLTTHLTTASSKILIILSLIPKLKSKFMIEPMTKTKNWVLTIWRLKIIENIFLAVFLCLFIKTKIFVEWIYYFKKVWNIFVKVAAYW